MAISERVIASLNRGGFRMTSCFQDGQWIDVVCKEEENGEISYFDSWEEVIIACIEVATEQ